MKNSIFHGNSMKVKTIIFFRENEFLSWSSCCETIPYDAGMWLTYFDQIKKNEAGELWRLNFSIQVNIIFHFQMLHLISRISAPKKSMNLDFPAARSILKHAFSNYLDSLLLDVSIIYQVNISNFSSPRISDIGTDTGRWII